MRTYFIIATVAYFLGSIPFGYILVRLFKKQDIRETGSGNIGATNVARSGAKGLAIATLLLDAGKGYLAVIVGNRLFLDSHFPHSQIPGADEIFLSGHVMLSAALAAFFVIIGHCFPVWLKFKGGKGVATGVGAFAAFAPKAALWAFIVFVIVLFVSRYVSLASVIAAAIFPVAAYMNDPILRSTILLSFIAGGCALIILKHYQNIRRLFTGTENRFGAKTT